MKTKTITAIAVEKDGRFLLLKRARHDTFPGLWEFPSGKVEEGESLDECARRELLEEAGLKAWSLKYMGKNKRQRDVITIVHYFHTKRFFGKPKLSGDHEDFKWASEKEILSMERANDSDKKHWNYGNKIGTDVVKFFSIKKTAKRGNL